MKSQASSTDRNETLMIRFAQHSISIGTIEKPKNEILHEISAKVTKRIRHSTYHFDIGKTTK